MDQLEIYRPDGSLQCGMGAAESLEESAKELELRKVEVLASRKGILPLAYPQMCGAPTGRVNIHSIAKVSLKAALAESSGQHRFAVWIFDRERIEVFKYDGSLQCREGTGTDPETMRTELVTYGVAVHSCRKDTDGLFHIRLCGALTGLVNVFEINSSSAYSAAALGYRLFLRGVGGTDLFSVDASNDKSLGPTPSKTSSAGIDPPFPLGYVWW